MLVNSVDARAAEAAWRNESNRVGTNPPSLPADAVEIAAAKFRELYERITGRAFAGT